VAAWPLTGGAIACNSLFGETFMGSTALADQLKAVGLPPTYFTVL
jgi:hypothetical protein